jgi:DNA polymerase-3 subunit epsilon
MQLQLSMAVADRLHETLLVRGEPIDAHEAACLLTASADCPPSLCQHILCTLVHEDRRFCWSTLSADTEATIPPSNDDSPHLRISLRNWEGMDPNLADVPFVALDLETTGARAGANKITEIGAVRIEGFREVATFSTLVNPLRPIPRMITEITGITQEMVARAPRIDKVIPQLLEFLEGAIVVAHNACFDVGFLNYELRRLRGRELGDGAIDTLPLARALAPGLPNYKLGTVAQALGAPVLACHRALADAQAVSHVFVTLMERLVERGVTRLSEARSFTVPSARPAATKLPLTRGLPNSPGTYCFVDSDGDVLLVGKADRLQERVRSHFVATSPTTRKMRQAVRQVEHIDWEYTHTSLEATVREQALILEHRPPCNQHRGRPEGYLYLKARDTGPGVCLYTSNRAPRSLDPGAVTTGRARHEHLSVVLGPFRGRARVAAALKLLQRCYPIRSCRWPPDVRPCARGQAGLCLAPCRGSEAVQEQHDALVREIIAWLTGDAQYVAHDPVARAEELMRRLAREKRHEDAQDVRGALDDLLSMRHSYEALAEARYLRFAVLFPEETNGEEPSLRLNVVWDGHLQAAASIRPTDVHNSITAALAACTASAGPDNSGIDRAETSRPVAVRQGEVDTLLAVRRWTKETEQPAPVFVTPKGTSPAHLAQWQDQLITEAMSLFGT